jgi:hypothetical protein
MSTPYRTHADNTACGGGSPIPEATCGCSEGCNHESQIDSTNICNCGETKVLYGGILDCMNFTCRFSVNFTSGGGTPQPAPQPSHSNGGGELPQSPGQKPVSACRFGFCSANHPACLALGPIVEPIKCCRAAILAGLVPYHFNTSGGDSPRH